VNASWTTTIRWLILAGSLGVFVWVAAQITPLIQLLIIAALLAYLLLPVVQVVQARTPLSHIASARLVFVLFLLLLAGIPAALGTVAVTQMGRLLGAELTAVAQEISGWISRPIQFLGYLFYPQELFDLVGRSLGAALGTIPLWSINLLSDISLNILWVILIFVCVYYFLVDSPRMKPWLLRQVPEHYCPEIERLLVELDSVWRTFLRVQILIFIILFILMSLGTAVVIWLFHSGWLGFSPVVLILLLIGVYTGAQQVDNLWLRPRWMGESLDLHPGLVLSSLMAALAVGGILGALLIVPGIATVKVAGGYIYRRLLDIPPWPEEEIVAEQPSREPL
jgi:predicted PurR-regulated permease PerM